MNYSPEQLLEAWKKGVPLSDAVFNYADNNLYEAYSDIKLDNSETNNDINYKDNFAGKLGQVITEFSQATIGLDKYNREKENAKIKLWHCLFEKIIKGNIIALGFKYPVLPDNHLPDLIPHHMWPPKAFDVRESSISNHNLKYVNIRIARKSALINKTKEKQNKTPHYPIKSKKTGRPTKSELIIKAFNNLDKNGNVDRAKNLTDHYDAIRFEVRRLEPNIEGNKGLSDETLRQHLASLFKD